RFDSRDLKGKYENKAKLKSLLGFNTNGHVPLIGVISRLAHQKGIDLIVRALHRILDLGAELVILGTGDKGYERLLKQVSDDYVDNFRAVIGYNEAKAHRIYAGSDMFLMPSRFEPCGLGQLIALRYGTIPVVRATGGLLDTIIDYDENRDNANGFIFDHFSERSMLNTIERAVAAYHNPTEWKHLIKNAMGQDFSWKRSSREYLDYYKTLF
ncbi:MAG: glycosyltransferase, partial [Myxococcales bacterium]|nr:glycosyltransferase [Myxococcales bacterium]